MAEDNIDFQFTGFGQLRQQIKEAQLEMINLAAAGKEGSAEFIAAAEKVGKLKDALGDATDSASALGTAAGKFGTVTKSLAGVAGGFSAIQGAIGLAGGNAKSFEKTMAKVQSAMALTQGLSALSEAGDSFKNLGKVATSTFQSLGKTANGTFSSIKAGIAATGIGLLVVALGAVAANFEEIKKIVFNLIPGLEAAFKSVQNLVQGFTDLIGLTSEEGRQQEKATAARNKKIESIDREIALAKAKGETDKVIALQEKKLIEELAQARADYNKAVKDGDAEATKEAGKRIDDLKNEIAINKVEKANAAKEDKAKRTEAAKEAANEAKAYAAERQAASDKIRSAEQKNILASIKDETEKAKKSAEFDKENSLKEIERGKYTAAEKKKLREESEKSYQAALAKIQEEDAARQKALQKELADALVNTDKEKFDQQQQQTTENYDKLIKKAAGNAEMQAKLEAQKQELLAEQAKTYEEKVAADKKAADDKKKEDDKKAFDDKVSLLDKEYQKKQTLLIQEGLKEKDFAKKSMELELQRLEEQFALAEKAGEDTVELQQQIAQATKEIKDAETEQLVANLNAVYDIGASLAQGLMELDKVKTDAKLANESLSEAEREKIAKESFEKQKKLQYAMATIDAAKAVTSILAQYPKFDGGFAMAAALIATGVATAMNIAKISATQYQSKSNGSKPAKSAGSTYQMGGIMGGPSHDMGGIKTAMGEIEGGEFVVNRRSSANFLPLLEQINSVGNNPGPEMANQTQPPIIKTYVVASEMTSQQEADAKLSSLARL